MWNPLLATAVITNLLNTKPVHRKIEAGFFRPPAICPSAVKYLTFEKFIHLFIYFYLSQGLIP